MVQRLVQAIRAVGAECRVGSTWTTDAPYRETSAEILHYQAEGVQVVEMESAGLFTVGQVRGLPAASVVVVMDSLADLKWSAPEKLDRIIQSLERVYAACINVLGAA